MLHFIVYIFGYGIDNSTVGSHKISWSFFDDCLLYFLSALKYLFLSSATVWSRGICFGGLDALSRSPLACFDSSGVGNVSVLGGFLGCRADLGCKISTVVQVECASVK